MHATRYHENGDPDVLRWEQVDVPAPGIDEVLLNNTAIGVGLKETGERKGIYPCPPLPTIPGITAAAEVLETGAEVTDFAPGDRVAYATLPAGSYCEQRVMPADRLVALPDDIDDQTAAALFHKGMTARFLVRKTYAIRAGDTVLVHAAAGGVGILLCQWAKHLGATVIGTVSTDAKAQVAAENGCDHPIIVHLKPMLAIVTNIDADHMSTYDGDLQKLRNGFVEFLHNLPFYGLAILCTDDPGINEVLGQVGRSTVTYGIDSDADIRAENIEYTRDDFVEAVNDITGGAGLPVVYDSVGKDTFAGSLECLQPLGLMVLYGIAFGQPPPLELMKFDIWKSYFFTRPSFYVHTRTREDLLESAGDLFEVVLSDAVKATISEQYPLKHAAEAHRAIESRRTTGSVILIP